MDNDIFLGKRVWSNFVTISVSSFLTIDFIDAGDIVAI